MHSRKAFLCLHRRTGHLAGFPKKRIIACDGSIIAIQRHTRNPSKVYSVPDVEKGIL